MNLPTKPAVIFDRTLDLQALMAIIIMTFIMLAVSYDVVMRYLLGHPSVWVVEITEYSLLYITFLSAAWVLRGEGHVKMDLVLTHLNPRTRGILGVITSVIGAIICLTLVWYSAQVTWEHFQAGIYTVTFLRVPAAPILVIIPVGSFMLFIQFLKRAYRYLGSCRASSNKQ